MTRTDDKLRKVVLSPSQARNLRMRLQTAGISETEPRRRQSLLQACAKVDAAIASSRGDGVEITAMGDSWAWLAQQCDRLGLYDIGRLIAVQLSQGGE
jgi:hypothetical protein